MIIDIKNNKVSFVNPCPRYLWDGDMKEICYLENRYWIGSNPYFTYNCNAKAIACFGTDVIEEHIENNLSEITDTKNIFTAPICNIPTIDLQNNGITRKRDFDSADLCVIPKRNFCASKQEVCLLKNKDGYALLADKGFRGYIHKQDKLEELKKYNKESTIEFFYQLQELGFLLDYEIEYFGDIILSSSDAETKFLETYDKYHHIVYQDDYLQYINNKKETLSLESFEEMKPYISSNDRDVSHMYLQMLSGYDISNILYEVVCFLYEHSYILRYVPFFRSGKFQAFLNSYNLKIQDITNGSIERCIEKFWDLLNDDQKHHITEFYTNNAIEQTRRNWAMMSAYSFLKNSKIINISIEANEEVYNYSGV